MTEVLKLFAYILELDGPSFSVSIKRSETVDDLKKAIKKENPGCLNGIDARELTLWKVAITTGGDVEKKAKDAIEGRDHLDETCELDEIFPEKPNKKTVSIVVKLPDSFGKGECLCDSRHVESLTYPSLSLFS